MDVQMADPSPMQINNLRGLALSPRREARARQGVSGQPLRRNIFAEAANLPAPSNLNNVTSAPDLFAEQGDFADDILDDDDDEPSVPLPPPGPSLTWIDCGVGRQPIEFRPAVARFFYVHLADDLVDVDPRLTE